MGASVVPAGKYTSGAASVRLQIALLADAGGRLWLAPLAGTGTVQQIAAGVPQGSRFFSFAPTADSAVVYVPGAGTLLALTSLSTQPAVETVQVPAGLLSAAIADTGALLVAASSPSGALLETRLSGGAFGAAIPLGRFGGMSFLSGGSDAVYGDAATNTIYLLPASTGKASVVASAKDGVRAPSAVAVSTDRHWAGVLNSADASLLRVDLSGSQPAERLSCACTPLRLSPLSGNGVFLMTDALPAAPVWALDVASTTPRTFFVPAQAGTADTAGAR
jgi:hypothetical protein